MYSLLCAGLNFTYAALVGKYYLAINRIVDWNTASQMCSQFGVAAHLATPNTAAEIDAVNIYLSNVTSLCKSLTKQWSRSIVELLCSRYDDFDIFRQTIPNSTHCWYLFLVKPVEKPLRIAFVHFRPSSVVTRWYTRLSSHNKSINALSFVTLFLVVLFGSR